MPDFAEKSFTPNSGGKSHDWFNQPAQLPSAVVQPKLMVASSDNPLEIEADQAADRVVNLWQNGSLKAPDTITTPTPTQPLIQRRAVSEAGAIQASPQVTQQIQSAQGGQALPGELLPPLEAAFGMDFSGVRLHTDARADALNRDLQARAFTTGQDIFFREGEYQPSTSEGIRLLGHELGHVGQQGGAFKGANLTIQRQEVPPSRRPSRRPSREQRVQRLTQEQLEQNQDWSPFLIAPGNESTHDSSIMSAIQYNNTLHIPRGTTNQIRSLLGLPVRPGVMGREFTLALMQFQTEGGITSDGRLNLDTFFLLNLGASRTREGVRERIRQRTTSLTLTRFQNDEIIRSLRIENHDFVYDDNNGNAIASDFFAAQLINWRMANGLFGDTDLRNSLSMEEVRLLSGQAVVATTTVQQGNLDESVPHPEEEAEQTLIETPDEEATSPQFELMLQELQSYLQDRDRIRRGPRTYRRRRRTERTSLRSQQRRERDRVSGVYDQQRRELHLIRQSRKTPRGDRGRIDARRRELLSQRDAEIERLRQEQNRTIQAFDAESQREADTIEANIPQEIQELDSRINLRISDFITSLHDRGDDFSDAVTRLEQRGSNTPNLAYELIRLIQAHRRGGVLQAAQTRQPTSMTSSDAERQLREEGLLQEVRPHESRGWHRLVGTDSDDVNRRATEGISILEGMSTAVDGFRVRLQNHINQEEFNAAEFTSFVRDIQRFITESTQRLHIDRESSRDSSLIVEPRNIASMRTHLLMPVRMPSTTDPQYRSRLRPFLNNLRREIRTRLTGQRGYTGSEPVSRFERAVIVNLHLSGVDVCDNRGNPFNISRMHIHPVFAVALYRFLIQLRAIGVTQVWTAGFDRPHRRRADSHPTGRALDITGFKFGDNPTSHENLIHLRSGYPVPQEPLERYVNITRGHSDWFDHQHMIGGRTHREILLGITARMTFFFGRVVAPGDNREHMNHFHVELFGNEQNPIVYGIQ